MSENIFCFVITQQTLNSFQLVLWFHPKLYINCLGFGVKKQFCSDANFRKNDTFGNFLRVRHHAANFQMFLKRFLLPIGAQNENWQTKTLASQQKLQAANNWTSTGWIQFEHKSSGKNTTKDTRKKTCLIFQT